MYRWFFNWKILYLVSIFILLEKSRSKTLTFFFYFTSFVHKPLEFLLFIHNDKLLVCFLSKIKEEKNKFLKNTSNLKNFASLFYSNIFLRNVFCLINIYFLGDDENQSTLNHSTLQYLFSTRTKHTSTDEATPILGFGLLQEPCVLVALLHTGIVVDLSVIDLYYLPRIDQVEPIVNTTKKVIIINYMFYYNIRSN